MVIGWGERHTKRRVGYSERDKIWLGLERALDYNNQDIFFQELRLPGRAKILIQILMMGRTHHNCIEIIFKWSAKKPF